MRLHRVYRSFIDNSSVCLANKIEYQLLISGVKFSDTTRTLCAINSFPSNNNDAWKTLKIELLFERQISNFEVILKL